MRRILFDRIEERHNFCMGIYVGFDPGGIGAFGWAVLSGDVLPLKLKDRGVADHAQGAFRDSRECVRDQIDGVGIDAPLFWSPAGDRNADTSVRRAITKLGSSGGTVGHINSLRGACLIQGMLVALICRRELKQVPITESHPKALLWLLGKATENHRPDSVTLGDLGDYVSCGATGPISDHERDAALGAVTSFAAVSKMDGWRDLYPFETNPVTPLNPPPGYWMPI